MQWSLARTMAALAVGAASLTGACGGSGYDGGSGSVQYSIAGMLTGLASGASVVLEDNGAGAITLTANGEFTLPTQLAGGATYNVTVMTQPSSEYCWVTSGSGTVAATNVSNVAVACAHVPGAAPVTLYTFNGTGVDGSGPTNLVQGNDGNLYGTLALGVAAAGSGVGCGGFFRMSTTGTETTIYNFRCDGSDAELEGLGNLIQGSDGAFYGTSTSGGSNDGGAVFRVTPQGVETLLFADFVGNNGAGPTGIVEGTDGNFYGTTYAGGVSRDGGTVFQITPSGAETVIDTFQGGASYVYPSPLIQASDGNFYGVTGGGAYNLGMVYSVTPAGARSLVYSFKGSGDGANPPNANIAPLIQGADGNLYGTTFGGGSANQGTIYRVTLAGVETVVYSFGSDAALSGTDGAYPAVLIQGSDGNLYGAAAGLAGGQSVIFEVTLDGHEVWRSSLGGDTGGPISLIQGSDGKFYGTLSGNQGMPNGFFFTF